jgi:hypothetical protein
VPTLAPVREAHCAVQLDPAIESRVDIIGKALTPEALIRLDSRTERTEFADYYRERAAKFRSRSVVPRDDDTFYRELF